MEIFRGVCVCVHAHVHMYTCTCMCVQAHERAFCEQADMGGKGDKRNDR